MTQAGGNGSDIDFSCMHHTLAFLDLGSGRTM